MSVLSDVREGVANLIRNAGFDSSLNVYEYRPVSIRLPAVVVRPSADTYIEYHGTFGALRMQTVFLTVEVIVPHAGSPESGERLLDDLLSSGTSESSSIADVLVGAQTFGDVFPGDARDHRYGALVESPQTPTVSAELPLSIVFKRS
jgi:hypothetical protein